MSKKITFMNLRSTALFIVFLCLTAWSCKKPQANNTITGDYFIYGHAGGFTTPNSRTTYFLVNNGKLLKDISQLGQAPPENIQQFKFNTLCPLQQYNSVADLPASVPLELRLLNNTTIGNIMPDAGHTDIRARINGTAYQWRFEANLDSTSQPIREFYNRCNISFR